MIWVLLFIGTTYMNSVSDTNNCIYLFFLVEIQGFVDRLLDRIKTNYDPKRRHNGYDGCNENNNNFAEGTDTYTCSSLSTSSSISGIDISINTPDEYRKIKEIFGIKMDLKAIEAHQKFQRWLQSISFPQRERDNEAKQNNEAETMRLTDEEWKQHFDAEWKRQSEKIETDINKWESDNVDDEEKEEEKLIEEMATKFYDNYGEEEFSCSSSKPEMESDDDRNLSFTSEWTLHDEEDIALYNELHKSEEEIKDLKTMYEADPEGNKHMQAFFKIVI